uniref:Uncharacterized protein n=1 Tax=Salvator merianae TaxID=96440 RepID=A0A8D0KMN4_SALMN
DVPSSGFVRAGRNKAEQTIGRGEKVLSHLLWAASGVADRGDGLHFQCFQSIIQPDLRRRGYASSSSSRYDDGRGPPGFPRRRMGRINHFGGPSPPPMAGGG